MEEETWDTSTFTALRVIFLGCRYAIPEMIKN